MSGMVSKMGVAGDTVARDRERSRGLRLALAQRAVVLMDEQYLDPGLDDRVIAEQLGISRMALLVAYRRQLGSTPERYLALRRVAVAKELLAQVGTRYPSGEVLESLARRAGFSSTAKMDAAFRRHALTTGYQVWLRAQLRDSTLDAG